MKFSDFPLLSIGNQVGLVGPVFGDDDTLYLTMFPGQELQEIEILEMDLDDWKAFLRQIDMQETEVLAKGVDGKLSKIILRKTQRLIEQRLSWRVFKRDGYRCRYCGNGDVPLTVDHLVLWEEGGPSTEENLVSSCRKCNKTRGNMQYVDWLNSSYYRKVRHGITNDVLVANRELLATLPTIPRRYAERKKR